MASTVLISGLQGCTQAGPPPLSPPPLSLSQKVFALTLDLGTVVGQPGGSALTKDLRGLGSSSRISCQSQIHSHKRQLLGLPQLDDAAVESSSPSLIRSVEPTASGDFRKSSDCNSPARGKPEKDSSAEAVRPPRLIDVLRAAP